MKRAWIWLVLSVVAGTLISLLSGLYDSTPAGLVGARWYGFPFAWMRYLVVPPQYLPWREDDTALVFDVVFWSVVCAAAIFLVSRLRHLQSPAR